MAMFNCATLPSELRAKQNMKWHVEGALSELIDNSLGKGRGNANHVTIQYDAKARVLNVWDNGAGMEHIGYLLQGGRGAGRIPGDIGEYGAGGTLALLWLAVKVEVWTLRQSWVMHDTVTWADWFDLNPEQCNVSDDWVPASVVNTPAELLLAQHGTFIKLHLLQGRRVLVQPLLKELSRTYAPGFRNGKRIDWTTMQKGEEIEIDTLTDPHVHPAKTAKCVDINITLECNGKHFPVRGRVYYDPNVSVAQSNIHIGYGHRVIHTTKDCFNSVSSDEHYTGIGVSGWLDLADMWKPYLTTTKDDISSADLKYELMEHVFKQIVELLEMSSSDTLATRLNGLLVGILDGLNSKPGAYEAEIAARAERKPRVMLVSPNPKPHVEPDPNRIKVPRMPKNLVVDADGKYKIQQPSSGGSINVEARNDKLMDGHLCVAEPKLNSIDIYINKEHRLIQEILRQMTKNGPTSQTALHFLILGELASCVAEMPNSYEMLKAWFDPRIVSHFENMPDGRDKARMLTRFLLDRVRNPISNEGAEAA